MGMGKRSQAKSNMRSTTRNRSSMQNYSGEGGKSMRNADDGLKYEATTKEKGIPLSLNDDWTRELP